MNAKRILIVDDEPDVASYTEVCLQRDGYVTEVVCSSAEALARYSPGRYDVVLTDNQMPGMTGLELAREIRRRQPDQPLVLVSGSPPIIPASVFDRVLTKPFGVSELREVVGLLSARNPPIAHAAE